MKDAPVAIPIGESLFPLPWIDWFNQVWLANEPFIKAYSETLVNDFGLIAGGAEASTTITIAGVRTTGTPTVLVTPSANTAGIIYQGVVTASNTVTIYAKNFTSGNINPASTTFRVTVWQ